MDNFGFTYPQADGSILDEDGSIIVESPVCKPNYDRGVDLVADQMDDDLLAAMRALRDSPRFGCQQARYEAAYRQVSGIGDVEPVPSHTERPWRPIIHAVPNRGGYCVRCDQQIMSRQDAEADWLDRKIGR